MVLQHLSLGLARSETAPPEKEGEAQSCVLSIKTEFWGVDLFPQSSAAGVWASWEHSPVQLQSHSMSSSAREEGRRLWSTPGVQLIQQGTREGKTPHLEKPLIEAAEGSPGLRTDDTPVTVSLEIWFDLINNTELQPHKNKMEEKEVFVPNVSFAYPPPVRLIPHKGHRLSCEH